MTPGLPKPRYPGLDILKFFASFLVICIHMSFQWKQLILPLARSAVPIFFMITGYFYAATERQGRQKVQLIKIVRLLFFSELLYILWFLLESFLKSGMSLSSPRLMALFRQALTELFSQPGIVRDFLFFNATRAGNHLWYLDALLYVLLFALLCSRFVERSRLYFLIPVLLLGKLLLGDYYFLLLDHPLRAIYSRNFLFLGLPFFLLGDLFRRQGTAQTASTRLLLAAIPVLLLGSLVESAVLRQLPAYVDRDLLICSILLAISLFLLAAKDLPLWNTPVCRCLSRWGRRYTLGIYILHVIVFQLVSLWLSPILVRLPPFTKYYSYLAPLLVLLLSLLLSAAFWYIRHFFSQIYFRTRTKSGHAA